MTQATLPAGLLLKVGELAKHSGLTVRTLHHYDSIGLLRPSGRSDSGYRLYNPDDVARLPGIQALRGLGLPLEEIGQLLGDGGTAMPGIIDRQLQALDEQIEQATRLRQHLRLVREKFSQGDQPALNDWLETLALMSTSGRYFSPEEMELIFSGWRDVEADWRCLVEDIRAEMDAGTAWDDPRVQPLAQRWMTHMHGWMHGNFDLMERWGKMYMAEPSMHNRGLMARAVVDFIEPAVQLRLSLYRRYLTDEQLRSLGHVPVSEWHAVRDAACALQEAGVPPSHPAAWGQALRFQQLLQRMARGDPSLQEAMRRAYTEEPLLRAGGLVPLAQREYLVQAAEAAQAAAVAAKGAKAATP
jgi:DNA-binding transcriptional MerR regulator